MIIDYLKVYNEITDEQVEELLNVEKTRAFVILKKMSDARLIKIIGRGATRKISF